MLGRLKSSYSVLKPIFRRHIFKLDRISIENDAPSGYPKEVISDKNIKKSIK